MFKTIDELKKRVMPALKIRAHEINQNNDNNITPDEIFNKLSKNKWKNNKNLHLYEIVEDILKYEESDNDGDK